PQEGTTSFLATTITQAPENIDRALQNVAAYENKVGHAEILGVHLEGPFIAKEKAGAQPVQYMSAPKMDQFMHWQACADNKIKTITLAPELDEDDFISKVSKMGINVSAGHTIATYQDMQEAVKKGVQQLTHLCNAMPGIHHRDVGPIGAMFNLEELRAELIADGIHVSREMLEIIYNNVGSKRLLLITDAMHANCMPPGQFVLGGPPVPITEARAAMQSRSRAGSILKIHVEANLTLTINDDSIPLILEMTAKNIAKLIFLFETKGAITSGKVAYISVVA